MTESKSKTLIKKITKWVAIIFFGFLMFQLLRLMFIMLFLDGQNPL